MTFTKTFRDPRFPTPTNDPQAMPTEVQASRHGLVPEILKGQAGHQPPSTRHRQVHVVKSHPGNFSLVASGQKPFEARKADRDYQVGDFLVLREYRPEDNWFSGAALIRSITTILAGGQWGVESGYAVLGIRELTGTERRDFMPLITSARSAAEAMSTERIKAALEPYLDGVYWSEEKDNFYDSKTHTGMGDSFYRKWASRRSDFPQQPSPTPPQRMDEAAKDWGNDSAMAFVVPDPNAPIPRQPAARVCSAHERELLLHLMQEAGEVIKAATKVMIFGKETIPPPGATGYDNVGDLGEECGNLQHMINVVSACELVDHRDITAGAVSKQAGLEAHLPKIA